jgi:hypothetical protein
MHDTLLRHMYSGRLPGLVSPGSRDLVAHGATPSMTKARKFDDLSRIGMKCLPYADEFITGLHKG